VRLDARILEALHEDIGAGDLATSACVPAAAGAARVIAKQDLVVSGMRYMRRVFELHAFESGAEILFTARAADGDQFKPGEPLFEVHGPLNLLIQAERVALNLGMRACGIATHAQAYVEAGRAVGIKVVDTRKTTPLWRDLEKEAVRSGGAYNHRYALYDGAMIKENHIIAAGSLELAVAKVRERIHHLVRIEVEAETLDEVRAACAAGADVILLDNMDNAMLKQAVDLARGLRSDVLLEASGNMTAERIATMEGIGVDLVSVGGLIHQARWADLSMRVIR